MDDCGRVHYYYNYYYYYCLARKMSTNSEDDSVAQHLRCSEEPYFEVDSAVVGEAAAAKMPALQVAHSSHRRGSASVNTHEDRAQAWAR